jgi:two-component system sensor histidine kinase AlgZ
MHPIFSDSRKFTCYILIWLTVAALMAKLMQIVGLANWLQALVFAVPVSLLYGCLASSAYYICRILPYRRRNFFAVLMNFSASSIISALLWLGLCYGWNQLSAFPDAAGNSLILSPALLWILFAFACGFYLLSILAYDVFAAIHEMHAAERRAAESRLHAREAELQVLRTQINPHFLFNSLNSISALTAFDPNAAREMTIALANFFRQTLALANCTYVSLAQEVALCKDFLAVEKVRFGQKLQSDWQIDTAVLTAQIPPMVLQPLLENALKHGIRNLDQGGCVQIRMQASAQRLHITVRNPRSAEADSHDAHGNGLGLLNLQQRLAALYGERARVSWRAEAQEFCVELILPFETNNA